jgi:ATP-binding cassette subfamily C (CFTR/MRP) protein 1
MNREPFLSETPALALTHMLPMPAQGAYYFTRSILTLIRTLEGKETSAFNQEWQGWILVGLFFVDAWLLGIALQRMAFGCLTTGLRARAALITAVTRRCLNMAHLTKETAADAVKYVAIDVTK